jgi:hypothetical protein
MQAAAGIGEAAAVIVMVMPRVVSGMILRMLMVVMRRLSGYRGQGICTRRRHHARKLGDHEQADQQTDKPRYCPQPFQNTLTPREAILGSLAVERQPQPWAFRKWTRVRLQDAQGETWDVILQVMLYSREGRLIR